MSKQRTSVSPIWRMRAGRLVAVTLLASLAAACSNAPSATAPASTVGGPGSTIVIPVESPTAPPVGASPTTASSTAEPAATGTITGTWKGTWSSTKYVGLTGTFTLNFQQSGSTLSGTIEIAGTPCISSASITGTLSGTDITFGFVNGAEAVSYTGTWTGPDMAGTWVVGQGSGAGCTADSGTWKATR
jgi:hypothetical protein